MICIYKIYICMYNMTCCRDGAGKRCGRPMGQVWGTEYGQTGIDGGHAARPTATVTVTIRMPVAMVEALKTEAERQGVRGYQTLLKRWIDERLAGDRVIPAPRLSPVLRR